MANGDNSSKTSIRDLLGTAAAALAAVGALWYALLSLSSAWVYEPVGVSASDVGLSSGTLLGQAASGLAATLLLMGFLTVTLAVLFTVFTVSRDPEFKKGMAAMRPSPADRNAELVAALSAAYPGLSESDIAAAIQKSSDDLTATSAKAISEAFPDLSESDIAALEETIGEIHAQVPEAELKGRIYLGIAKMAAYAGVGAALLLAVVVMALLACHSRESIKAGQQPGFLLGLPLPWNAKSADIHPATNSTPGFTGEDLPSCALYLGETDGVVVMRDGPGQRTLRLPSSTVRLDIRNRHECPDGS